MLLFDIFQLSEGPQDGEMDTQIAYVPVGAPFSPPLFDDDDVDEDDAVVSATNQPPQFMSPPRKLPTPAPRTSPPIPARRHSPPTQQSTSNTSPQPRACEQSQVPLPALHPPSTQPQGAKKRKAQDNDDGREYILKSLAACREMKQNSDNHHFALNLAKILDGLPRVKVIRLQVSMLQMAVEATESLHTEST